MFFCKGNVAQTSWETERIGKKVAWIISSSFMMNVLAATIPVENRIVIPVNKSETSWWSNCHLIFWSFAKLQDFFPRALPHHYCIFGSLIYIKLSSVSCKQTPKITHAHFHVKVMYWSACETLIKLCAYYCLGNIHVLRNHKRQFFIRFSTESYHKGKENPKSWLRNTWMVRYLPVWFFKCQICAKYSEVNTLQISGYYFWCPPIVCQFFVWICGHAWKYDHVKKCCHVQQFHAVDISQCAQRRAEA